MYYIVSKSQFCLSLSVHLEKQHRSGLRSAEVTEKWPISQVAHFSSVCLHEVEFNLSNGKKASCVCVCVCSPNQSLYRLAAHNGPKHFQIYQ